MNMLKKLFGNKGAESTASKPEVKKFSTSGLMDPNHAAMQIGIPSEEEISPLLPPDVFVRLDEYYPNLLPSEQDGNLAKADDTQR